MRAWVGWVAGLALLGSATVVAADFENTVYDVELDSSSGTVQATVTITLRPMAPLPSLYLLMDRGLSVSSVSASAGAVSAAASAYQEWSAVHLSLQPGVGALERRDVTVSYGGTLWCGGTGSQAGCDIRPAGMSRFTAGSLLALPHIEGASLGPLELTLRVPSGSQVAASGERVAQADDGQRLTTKWVLPARVALAGHTLFAGRFASRSLLSAPVEVTFHHAHGDAAWAPRMDGFIDRAIAHVTAFAGQPMPFPHIQLVKLEPSHRESGYTCASLVNLSDWHGSFSDATFREEWVHELAHLFFGVTVIPTDFDREWLISEGSVVLAEWDWAAAHEHPGRGREAYLAHRSHEAQLLTRYVIDRARLPPLLAARPADTPNAAGLGTVYHWAWAYARAPATLDYLRVVLGEQAFQAGLHDFVARCLNRPCAVPDLQAALERSSASSLEGFFDTWVRQAPVPKLEVGFEQRQGQGGYWLDVRLHQATRIETPVELWLEGEDGAVRRERVTLAPAGGTHSFTLAAPVRRVRPNPRLDALLWSRSAVRGDVDFDGDVDGVDLIRCARGVGRRVSAPFTPSGDSLTGVDLDFDTRCDLIEDGALDDADLGQLEAHFGEVRR